MFQSLTSQELHDKMQNNEVFILDVRAASAYDDWKITGDRIISVNVQTSKIKEFGPEAFVQIPKDREIIVTCAKGNASREATEILANHGYRAVNLEGGMQSWSEFYYYTPVVVSEQLELLQVIRPAKGCLSYMLVSDNEAIVIDPSRNHQYYVELASEKGVAITHVLDTHCHADHISGGAWLANATGAAYWVAESEMIGAKVPFHALEDGKMFAFGVSTLEVLAVPTPGHTPGSTSFFVNNKFLLSGDTVFVSGLGRPDLGGKAHEWAKMLYDTVVDKLHKISDDVLILPAHYSDYTEITEAGYVGAKLGDIRKDNELLREVVAEDAFTGAITGNLGLTPPNYDTIVHVNRGLAAVNEQEASDLEIGPNRCAVKHLA